jgi:hypothetical protein
LAEVDASIERQYQRDMKIAQQLRRQAAKLNNIGINSGSDLLTVKTKRSANVPSALRTRLRPRIATLGRRDQASPIAARTPLLVSLDDVPVTTPAGDVCSRPARSASRKVTASCCSAATASASRASSA